MKNKVYVAHTDAFFNDDNIFRKLYDCASQERKTKTDKFVFRKDKLLSLTAEALLKKALSDIGITDCDIRYSEYGKPYSAGKDIFFSLSHSEKAVMCAVSEMEIGADTEKITAFEPGIAERFFHRKESEMLLNAPNSEKAELFFRLWTLKESFTKALGLGMSQPFNSFFIDITKEPATVCRDITDEEYFFKEYKTDDGYKYAVCSLCPDFENEIRFVKIEEII